MTEYDETGSIGKRYRRQDEIGTPIVLPSTLIPLKMIPSPLGSGYHGTNKTSYP